MLYKLGVGEKIGCPTRSKISPRISEHLGNSLPTVIALMIRTVIFLHLCARPILSLDRQCSVAWVGIPAPWYAVDKKVWNIPYGQPLREPRINDLGADVDIGRGVIKICWKGRYSMKGYYKEARENSNTFVGVIGHVEVGLLIRPAS